MADDSVNIDVGDAADEASKEINANTSWHNSRRFLLPPLVNEYCAMVTTHVIEWKISNTATSSILEVPFRQTDFNTLFYAFPYFQSSYPQSRSNWDPMCLNTFIASAPMIERLRLTYDEYRVRSMKFILEPTLIQNLVNYQPMDAYAWFPKNPMGLDLNNPQNEYEDYDALRNDINGGNREFRRLAYVYGKKAVCEFVPQVYVKNQFGGVGQAVLSDAYSLVPCPWLQRNMHTTQLYTPIMVFRQPFGAPSVSYSYQVTVKACIEFRKPNPNDES